MAGSRYRWTRFAQSRVGRFGARLLRWTPYRRFISRRVWREFLSDPEARASLDAGMEDLKAHRTYQWHHGTGVGAPNPLWAPDDPIQPDGWRHDGTQWVRLLPEEAAQ